MENRAEQKIQRAKAIHRNLVAKNNPYSPKVQRVKKSYKRRSKHANSNFES